MIYYREKPADLQKNKEREFALELLSEGLQEEYALHTLPVILRPENGKPYFASRGDICFNYSHSKTKVACGIDREEIGVDIEDIRPVKISLIRYVCHENEIAWVMEPEEEEARSERMIMLWTMKEAYVKYHGIGIRYGMKKLDLSSLLSNEGNGTFEGCIMQVYRIGDSFLSVYSKNKLYVARK